MYKAIDLFAGIGGIRLGFEQAFDGDIETVFTSDIDRYAKKTYAANFNTPVDDDGNVAICGDIRSVDAVDIQDFDICLAGFPCQAFSCAGRRLGFDDDYKGLSRGTLFFEVARIVEAKRPSVVFCENVKGLTSHDRGRTFKIICGRLEQLGYKVFSKVLNSRDFGVPQNRERIYIIAFRNDIAPDEFGFPKPTDSTKTIRDIMEADVVPAKYYVSETYLTSMEKRKQRNAAKGNGFGYVVRDINDVAGAIVCGGMGRERNLIVDDRQTDLTPMTNIKGEINKQGIRKMTPREWARLQGFPDDFKFVVSDTQLYKQFGNSVTVPVIREIAAEIRKTLTKQMPGSCVTDVNVE